jgi:hypothetical protein
MSYLVWFTEVLAGFIEDQYEGIKFLFFPSLLIVYCTIYSFTEKSGLGGNTYDMYSGDGLNLGQDIGWPFWGISWFYSVSQGLGSVTTSSPKIFSSHHSPVIPEFDAIWSEIQHHKSNHKPIQMFSVPYFLCLAHRPELYEFTTYSWMPELSLLFIYLMWLCFTV